MIQLKLSREVYSLKSIKDTIYWLSSRYTMILDQNDTHYLVNVETDKAEFSKLFSKTLNDYSLRDMIAQQTKDIKNLVVSKAFYPELVKFNTIGEFDDPVNMDKNEAK